MAVPAQAETVRHSRRAGKTVEAGLTETGGVKVAPSLKYTL